MKKIINYYFLLLLKDDFLKNQALEEIFRERSDYYNRKKKLRNFWIFPSFNLNYLQNAHILEEIRKIVKFKGLAWKQTCPNHVYKLILSTDKEFINFLQLRTGLFENIDISHRTKISQNFNNNLQGLYGKFTHLSFVLS